MRFSNDAVRQPTRRTVVLGTAGIVAAGFGLGAIGPAEQARATGDELIMGGDLGMLAEVEERGGVFSDGGDRHGSRSAHGSLGNEPCTPSTLGRPVHSSG